MPTSPHLAADCARRVPPGPGRVNRPAEPFEGDGPPVTARALEPTIDGDALPDLPEDVWEHVFSYLPPATLARLPARGQAYRNALRDTFGLEDVAMGPAPRRTLAAACGLTHARRLEVSVVPMPAPPDWVAYPERTDTEVVNAAYGIFADPFFPPRWGMAHGDLATWGTKVAFVVENTPLWHNFREDPTKHAGVAVLDTVTQTWTQLHDVSAHAIVLGAEGIFATGDGRLTLLTWEGQRVWQVDVRTPLSHLALGSDRLAGMTKGGNATWWDRATGAHLGCAQGPTGEPDVYHFARLPDGFAGGTHDGRILIWADAQPAAPPRELRETMGVSMGTAGRLGPDAHIVDLRAGPEGVVSATVAEGIRWRPSLDVPASSVPIVPPPDVTIGTLQQVAEFVFWVAGEPVERRSLMRASKLSGDAEAVTAPSSLGDGSVLCGGAYYTFDFERRALLRIAARQA